MPLLFELCMQLLPQFPSLESLVLKLNQNSTPSRVRIVHINKIQNENGRYLKSKWRQLFTQFFSPWATFFFPLVPGESSAPFSLHSIAVTPLVLCESRGSLQTPSSKLQALGPRQETSSRSDPKPPDSTSRLLLLLCHSPGFPHSGLGYVCVSLCSQQHSS